MARSVGQSKAASSRPKLYRSTACDQCFRTKTRCDSGMPNCQQCRKSNKPCTYSSRKHSTKGRSRKDTTENSDQNDADMNDSSGVSQYQHNIYGYQSQRESPQCDAHTTSFLPTPQSSESGVDTYPYDGFADVELMSNTPAEFNLDPQLSTSHVGLPFPAGETLSSTCDMQELNSFLFTPPDPSLTPATSPDEALHMSPKATLSITSAHSSTGELNWLQTVSNLYSCQELSDQTPIGTMLASAREGQAMVLAWLDERNATSKQNTKSTTSLLACIQIMHQVLLQYARLKSQLGQRQDELCDSIQVGVFESQVPELCQKVFETIIDQEVKSCRQISKRLQKWFDEQDTTGHSDRTITRAFMEMLQNTFSKVEAF